MSRSSLRCAFYCLHKDVELQVRFLGEEAPCGLAVLRLRLFNTIARNP